MHPTTVLAALAAATGAFAIDARLLFKHADENPTKFCKSYKCACVNYEPQNTTLYFQATYCHPGDYRGQNNRTEALAYCSFLEQDGQKQVFFSTEVGKEVGATPTTST